MATRFVYIGTDPTERICSVHGGPIAAGHGLWSDPLECGLVTCEPCALSVNMLREAIDRPDADPHDRPCVYCAVKIRQHLGVGLWDSHRCADQVDAWRARTLTS